MDKWIYFYLSFKEKQFSSYCFNWKTFLTRVWFNMEDFFVPPPVIYIDSGWFINENGSFCWDEIAKISSLCVCASHGRQSPARLSASHFSTINISFFDKFDYLFFSCRKCNYRKGVSRCFSGIRESASLRGRKAVSPRVRYSEKKSTLEARVRNR